jgi:beta-glucosidase
VLEKGEYSFFIGADVRTAHEIYTVCLPEDIVVKECVQALAPVTPFRRIRPEEKGDMLIPAEEDVPLSEVDEEKRRLDALPEEIPYTGDKGIKLADVLSGKNTMEEFIAQLSDYDLSCIIRGEGMGSPKVTAGTASAFGGVSEALRSYGIPAVCCDDGPSGMRLDCGEKACSLPNGTMIASTFNRKLTYELFTYMGLEMTTNNVDSLLGPGMNLHRHPLNGRNFEYFSEDPYLTGTMAAEILNGLHSSGVTGTIKHFCGNNQEKRRHFVDSVVSERALREIYLRSFEIAVRTGNADTIMTTYGKVNGLWTAGNYDLNTTILRRDWGYTGLTMTDWWANINRRGQEPDRSDLAAMAMAQNDLYMVCADSSDNEDNTLEELEKGVLRRSELQRNAANICRVAMNTYAMKRLLGTADTTEIINRPAEDCNTGEAAAFYELTDGMTLDLGGTDPAADGTVCFVLIVKEPGWYNFEITAGSDRNEDVKLPLSLLAMSTPNGVLVWNGTDSAPVTRTKKLPFFSRYTSVRLESDTPGLKLSSLTFRFVAAAESLDDIAFGDTEGEE